VSLQYGVMVFIILICFLAMFNTRALRKKIRCRYTSRSNQTYEKFVPAKSASVVFEGRKFFIVPSCVKHHWFDKGLSQLFPTFMPEMDFIWNSQYPVDPKTALPVILSPEVANALDQEGSMQDYAGSQKAAIAGGKRAGGLEKYLPWIAIGGVALIGIYVYMSMSPMSKDMDIIKQAISDIYTKLGIGVP
jgi:hypothetical protein